MLYSFCSMVLSSEHFECNLQKLFKVPPASVYFLRLCCSFRFRYSITYLLKINKPALTPLATGTTTSPTPLMVVWYNAETASTKTPSTDYCEQFMSLFIYISFVFVLFSFMIIKIFKISHILNRVTEAIYFICPSVLVSLHYLFAN